MRGFLFTITRWWYGPICRRCGVWMYDPGDRCVGKCEACEEAIFRAIAAEFERSPVLQVESCWFDGNPPAPHVSWIDYWITVQQTGVITGLRISALE